MSDFNMTLNINTIKGVKEDLQKCSRPVKKIAAECKVFASQCDGEWGQAAFERLSDCKTRKEFYAVIDSLLN